MIPHAHHQAAAAVDLALRRAWHGATAYDACISVKAAHDGVTVFAQGDAATNWVRGQNPWKLAGLVPLFLMHRGAQL